MTSTTTTTSTGGGEAEEHGKGGEEEVVKLNVGGRQFTTYKSTLMAYPDTMLARMFSSSAGI